MRQTASTATEVLINFRCRSALPMLTHGTLEVSPVRRSILTERPGGHYQ